MSLTYFIGLGTNLGARRQNLDMAVSHLSELGLVLATSSIYETPPWGITAQPSFYNQVVQLKTSHWPFELLNKLLAIEQQMGRVRKIKWGERLIDLDILAAENLIISTPSLHIPHPFIQLRRFVLAPWAEIAPSFIHPVFGQSIAALLATTPDTSEIIRLNNQLLQKV